MCSNMFRITEDPSSGILVQCLVKNYKYDSTISVDMDKVVVMAVYAILCYTLLYPFHVVLAVNLSLKQTALVLSNYSHNMLP